MTIRISSDIGIEITWIVLMDTIDKNSHGISGVVCTVIDIAIVTEFFVFSHEYLNAIAH